MKVIMTEKEKWCGEYAERWNKPEAWDSYILVKDAWLAGFKKAREECVDAHFLDDEPSYLNVEEAGEKEVEVDVGYPQTGMNEKHGAK